MSAILIFPLICVLIASITPIEGTLLLGAMFGHYLILSSGYVYRDLDRMPKYDQSAVPMLHAASLTLFWPVWALRLSHPATEGTTVLPLNKSLALILRLARSMEFRCRIYRRKPLQSKSIR